MVNLNFIIKKIGHVRTGISPRTGNYGLVRDIILLHVDKMGVKNYICATATYLHSCDLKAGDKVSAELRFRTRQLPNCQIANNIQVVHITKIS